MIGKWRAAGELIVADIFWGFGFVAVEWALVDIPSFYLNGVRFLLAFLVATPWLFFRYFRDRTGISSDFKLSIVPGVILGVTILLQTWGMEYTTATNSGFITTLYVLFVPAIEAFFFAHRVSWPTRILIAISISGCFLISRGWEGQFNWGDLLTLICAVTAALHIVWIGKISKQVKDAFAFNVWQCLWAALLSLVLAVRAESWNGHLSEKSWIGLASLVLGSTLFGFFVQVRAQRILTPVVSSLLFLLESPLAALFALLLLGEVLAPLQWLGAALILIAAAGGVYLEANFQSLFGSRVERAPRQ